MNLKIQGNVQGVGFRYATLAKARLLDLKGWVKNESDGTVTVVAEGSKDGLNQLLVWSRKGPAFSKIQHVDVRWTDEEGAFDNFRILD